MSKSFTCKPVEATYIQSYNGEVQLASTDTRVLSNSGAWCTILFSVVSAEGEDKGYVIARYRKKQGTWNLQSKMNLSPTVAGGVAESFMEDYHAPDSTEEEQLDELLAEEA